MIEDLDGVTSEPTRRAHVVMLSSAVAIASLVLLLTLVVPAPVGTAPQATSPAPSARTAPVTMFVSNPLRNLRLDLTHASLCPDGTRLDPPYQLSVDDLTGRTFAVRIDGGTHGMRVLSVPVIVVFNVETGWMNVACATPLPVVTGDIFVGPSEFDER